jgi:hypothetical protein
VYPPKIFAVKQGNVPKINKGLVADLRDEVIMFSYSYDGLEAIGFNAQIQRGGRIPADRLETKTCKPFLASTLCLARNKETPKSIDHIGWCAGEHLSVWDRVEGRHLRAQGFCFNRSTGGIKKFETASSHLKPLS